MFPVHRTYPSPPLAEFVRFYEERRSTNGEETVVRPLPARVDQFVEFFLGDPYWIRTSDGAVSAAPRVVAVGLQTRRGVDILLSGDLHMFSVKFTPTGFHALFGTPQHLLTDIALPAAEAAPRSIAELAGPLTAAASMTERVALIEAWLLDRLSYIGSDVDPVAWAARLLLHSHGRIGLDALIDRSGLGWRQFERRFKVQVGTGPKRFARIARFQQAITLKQRDPALAWTAIAQDAGFADQAHMNHEFSALCGERPGKWLLAITPARETLTCDHVGNRQFRELPLR